MRTRIEKLIAIIGAILIGIGVYIAPVPFGAVPCAIKPFSAKPTTILTAEKTADIITSVKNNTTLSSAINTAVSFIDAKQSAYKIANGQYFKGNITHNTIPTLGETALPENNACGNKEGKTWANFGEFTSALPFAVGVAPYKQGNNEGYTIEFFVQKGGRTFVKAVSRGFEATQRTRDWHVHSTAEGLAINKSLMVKDISKLKRLFKPYYAYAVDVNSRDFEESAGDYANTADSTDLSLAGAYTFDFEMNAESIAAGGANRIISKLGGAGLRMYQLSLSSATAMNLTHSNDGTATTDTTINFTTSFVVGTWYRITVTHDGSGNIRAYVNCTSEFTGTNATSAINDNTVAFRLGAQTNASDAQTVEKFDGLLNNVAIYKAVVEPTINNEADSIDLNNANLVAYWDLENSGTDTAGADAVADNLTFTGTVNSTNVAGTLCVVAGAAIEENISIWDIF